MKNFRFFLSENFPFFVKFSVYLNRLVFVMLSERKSGFPIFDRLNSFYLFTGPKI